MEEENIDCFENLAANSNILNSELSDIEENEQSDYRDTLVGNVIVQLEELTKHIRKVSMPPGVSPAPVNPIEINNNFNETDLDPLYLHVNDKHLEILSTSPINFEVI